MSRMHAEIDRLARRIHVHVETADAAGAVRADQLDDLLASLYGLHALLGSALRDRRGELLHSGARRALMTNRAPAHRMAGCRTPLALGPFDPKSGSANDLAWCEHPVTRGPVSDQEGATMSATPGLDGSTNPPRQSDPRREMLEDELAADCGDRPCQVSQPSSRRGRGSRLRGLPTSAGRCDGDGAPDSAYPEPQSPTDARINRSEGARHGCGRSPDVHRWAAGLAEVAESDRVAARVGQLSWIPAIMAPQ